MASLPKDHRGFPVPWFVAWANGKPDFRCVAEGKIEHALRHRVCWVCGKALGLDMTFVTGPLCAINGTAAEPPAHRECGRFSAVTCPFLIRPRMRRNGKDLIDDAPHPAGQMIERNPGVVLLWTTTMFLPVVVGAGVLFRVGPAKSIEWFAEGRPALRSEVMASLEDGLPHLRKMAEAEGPAAISTLDRLIGAARSYLPPEK